MIRIRDINLENAEEYIRIVKQIDSESPFMIREPGEYKKNKDDIELEITKAHSKKLYFRVVEIENKIVGYARISRSNKTRLKHKAEFTIAIVKSETGKGLGTKLLEDCIKWCGTNGVERLDLKVAADNLTAINLYKKFGFVKTGDYFKDIKLMDHMYLDFIHMSRFIDGEHSVI